MPSDRQQKEAARLRSSCKYCRRRKIKCDGNSPCLACTTRSLECVFEKQAKMGRPTQSQSPSSNGSVAGSGRFLVEALYDIHSEMFMDYQPTSAFSVGLQRYMQEKAPYLLYGAEEMQMQKPCTPPVYDALLPALVQDLIERCKVQYSSLGQVPNPMEEMNRPSYLAVALVRDHSEPPTSFNQLESIHLEDTDFAPLAQIWSTSHPLAECVLLSNAYGKDPLNKALRSIIVSEAFTLVTPPRPGSNQALEQAHRYFYDANLPRQDDPRSLLLACQISSLLSWHHLAHTTVKRGIAFLALSCQLMAQINNHTACRGFLLDNLKSQLSLITVWAFSQLDRTSGCLIDMGDDPETVSLSHFYCISAQMSSLLLNSHPNAYGTSIIKLPNVDFTSLCDQLRMGLRRLPLKEDSLNAGQILIRAVRDILTIYLFFPRKSSDKVDVPPPPLRSQDIVHHCSLAIPLLAKLANPTQEVNHPAPLLSKVTYRRPAVGRTDIIAMQCTIASVLFVTLAEALQAVLEQEKEPSSYTSTLIGISQQLLHVPLTLVVETQQATDARNKLTSSLATADNRMATSTQDWLESIILSALPKSSTSSQGWNETDAISEPDLFDTLWGQLQWDIPLASAEIVSSGE